MSIQSAIQLLAEVGINDRLRDELNACDGKDELTHCLKSGGFCFNLDEFEDAVRVLHVRCQEQEQAEFLLEKALWLRFIIQTNEYGIL